MRKLVIIGTGSTAQRVYDFVKYYDLYEIIGYAADSEYVKSIIGGGA